MPEKFSGRMGDAAMGFMAACNNFREMDPRAFANDEVAIRWTLQLLTGAAKQWKVRQMTRMNTELDSQGRAPREFRKWEDFWQLFLAHYADPSLVERARAKWKQGITQKGRAVDYFEEIESNLLRLGYKQNSAMVLDVVYMGLKHKVKLHFIGRQWRSLNEMKEQIIPYDASLWEINCQNQRAIGEKTQTQTRESKATNTSTLPSYRDSVTGQYTSYNRASSSAPQNQQNTQISKTDRKSVV